MEAATGWEAALGGVIFLAIAYGIHSHMNRKKDKPSSSGKTGGIGGTNNPKKNKK